MSNRKGSIKVLSNFLYYSRLFSIWPPDGMEFEPPRTFYFSYIFQTMLMTLIIISSMVQNVRAFKAGGSTQQILTDSTELMTCLGCYLFGIAFLWSIPKIAPVFWKFSDYYQNQLTWNEGRSTLEKYNTYSRIWFHYISISIFGAIIYKLFIDQCSDDPYDHQRTCGLFYNTYIPFRYDFFPVKQLICSIQIWIGIVTVKVGSSCAFCVVESTQHIVVRIQAFKSDLNQWILDQLEDPTCSNRSQFKKLIREHCEIIKLAHEFKRSFKTILFTYFAVTNALIGLVLFATAKTYGLGSILCLFGWLGNFYFSCESSEKLCNMATSVASTIYDTNWYLLTDYSTKNDLRFMLFIAQKPIYLESCSFSHFSRDFFLSVLKSAYSFMALLMKLYE